jgi:formate/nitrite transporter FocA (FNT family)
LNQTDIANERRDSARERARQRQRHDDVSGVEEEAEEEVVSEATRLSSRLIYEVVRRDGEEELARPLASLVWSGIAAGILISFSVIGEAVIHSHLPDRQWRPLVENFGYTFGFLLVIHGRMQLFTENTITTVLPLMARFRWDYVNATGRLWGTVLAANVVGAFVAAGFILWTGAFSDEMLTAIGDLSRHALEPPPLEIFFRAMPAGVLIAALVWMMPTMPQGSFFMIVAFTWLIAAGDFSHVVAGSVEMAFLILSQEAGFFPSLATFFVPALLGNIAGGTMVFTLMAWAQVMNEVSR